MRTRRGAPPADPERFPEQVADGLAPWQARKFYFRVRFPFGMGVGSPGFPLRPARDPSMTTVDLGGYDPLLGATWAEIGSLARGMHKCQGMGQFVALPSGPVGGRYRLTETTIADHSAAADASLFDGVDTSIAGLARFAGEDAPAALDRGLAELARQARAALDRFAPRGWPAPASRSSPVSTRYAPSEGACRRWR